MALNSYIFQTYQTWLNKKKEGDGNFLNGTVTFLENTTVLVKFFQGLHLIRGMDDPRLKELKGVMDFFDKWEADARSSKKYARQLLSAQCRDDLYSTVYSFMQLCDFCINHLGIPICPGRINSDIVENM